ncbi:MAG TPA: MGMT family protein [Candidatus Paceibacterota bacterium]|nr:MGMT family protein [Candidatus Paceibacterota bacterium]HMO82924.1 MGMT family protein [Candidatus Paceibacterota bacterium]
MPIKKLKNKLSFRDQVRQVVKLIPKGQTMSYKGVAAACQNPNGARAVARVMATNYDPEVPCHRVVHSNGKVGEYNRGGNRKKASLLEAEGCIIKQGYVSRRETK